MTLDTSCGAITAAGTFNLPMTCGDGLTSKTNTAINANVKDCTTDLIPQTVSKSVVKGGSATITAAEAFGDNG